MLAPRVDEEAVSILGLEPSNSSGETRLLTALLERAILDYIGNDQAEAECAREWIFNWQVNTPEKVCIEEDDEEFKPFSFKWVCHILDLNPFKVAAYIKAIPKRGANRIAPWYSDRSRSFSSLTSVR